MKKKSEKQIKKFKPSIPDKVRNDPEFRKEIRKFIKASLTVYKLDDF